MVYFNGNLPLSHRNSPGIEMHFVNSKVLIRHLGGLGMPGKLAIADWGNVDSLLPDTNNQGID